MLLNGKYKNDHLNIAGLENWGWRAHFDENGGFRLIGRAQLFECREKVKNPIALLKHITPITSENENNTWKIWYMGF